MQTFEERWNSVRAHLMKHADDLEYNAGMSGSYNDGGARTLRENIKMFEAGMSRIVPAEWERIVAPLMDPEFAEYQRLKAKFERNR